MPAASRSAVASTHGRTSSTPLERDVLALERRGWASPGAKERAIREELGMVPVRYYQLLNALLDARGLWPMTR